MNRRPEQENRNLKQHNCSCRQSAKEKKNKTKQLFLAKKTEMSTIFCYLPFYLHLVKVKGATEASFSLRDQSDGRRLYSAAVNSSNTLDHLEDFDA